MSDFPLYILVLLVLVPLSGFIAWAGDRIGHRIGKRRHSFLGLRPRHTATVFTVGAGVGIALVSFGLLLLSNGGLRLVLSAGTRLLTQNKTLRAENERLTRDGEALARQIAEAQAAVERADAARTDAERARSNAEKRLSAAAAAEKQAQTDLARARRALSDTRTDLKGARERVAQAQKLVETARAQVRVAQEDLRSARSKEKQALEKFDGAQRSFNALADYQKDLSEKLAAQAKALEQQRAEYAAQTALLEKQLSDQRLAYDTEMREQEEERQRLRNEVGRLEARRSDLNRLLDMSLSSTTNLRRSPITYHVGEEVARASLPSNITIWRVTEELEKLLADASRKAQTRGAARGDGPRAVILLPRPSPDQPGGTPTALLPVPVPGGGAEEAQRPVLTEDDAVRASAGAIRRANEEVVVILTAATNAVVGEPVPVEMRTYRNPRVLASGEKVAEKILDGSGERQAVADAVYAFLRQDVRTRLLEAGVIPTAPGGDADSDDIGSVVNLSGSQWLQVLDDVRRAGQRARITVKAAHDLRAADPPALTFEVRALPTPYSATAASGR
mgnify:CR=1 FL=1|jgi:Uncharacterized protein conserved in bacteria with the myosin-like domain